MEGDQKISVTELEVECRLQGWAVEQIELANIVDAEPADQEDPLGVFAELDDAPAVVLGGDEV